MISRNRNLLVLAIVLAAELLALAYQVHRNRDVHLLRQVSMLVVTPVQREISALAHGTVSVWRNYLDLRGARRESYQLERELDQAKLENQRLQDEAAQGKRLEVLLQFKQQVNHETLTARVISSGGGDSAKMVVIDRGREAGLAPDMAVITPDGIVGKVLRVFPFASQVLLVTDANSGVATLLETSRLHGILKGQNKALGSLAYVLNDEKVEIGEKVFTSGEDQIYPKGLPVGVVVEVRPGAAFQEIQVQPFAKINRLEEVLVITRKMDVELPPIPAASGRPEGGLTAAAPAPEPSPESQSATRKFTLLSPGAGKPLAPGVTRQPSVNPPRTGPTPPNP